MKILVLSCDKYSYLWKAFFQLLDKYYPNHPEVYLSTETKKCEYCKTININSEIWTERFRKSLEKIDDEQILVMLEDFFIRRPVNEKRINEALDIMKNNKNVAVCNFEIQYREGLKSNFKNFDIQKNNQQYLNSCQPSIWNKKVLIDRLKNNSNAWDWETTTINSPYQHLINNTNDFIIDIGYRHQKLEDGGWGVTRGKISPECEYFLQQEGISLKQYKLSIITPYYNVLEYTKELAKSLEPQLTEEVEWIIIDDGCHEKELDNLKAKIIHLEENSGGASLPRNIGIKEAQGEYITFIDADDLVEKCYIEKILNKIETSDFDFCLFSWRGIGVLNTNVIITDMPPEWNTSVWNCIYKTSKIRNIKFNLELCMAEDNEFNKIARKGKKENIIDILYIYRSGVKDGLTYKQELYNKKFKKDYDYSNVFYFYRINTIGGVETFFYELAKKYNALDITVFYESADEKQIERLKKFIRVKQYTGQKIKCKKVFFNYNMDAIDNFTADEYYEIIHADYGNYTVIAPPQHPKITHYLGVTQAVCDAFTKITGKPCELCYNPLTLSNSRKILHLVSATRLTFEKGADRIELFAQALEKANIPYEWIIFSNKKGYVGNHNIVFKEPQLDIYDYLKRADYVVQLSDTESFCYTMVESLSLGTPVIVCPWPCLKELGVNETNSFILPFDMQNIPIQEIYTKEFNFEYHAPADTWDKFLTTDKSTYIEEQKTLYEVEALRTYKEENRKDCQLGYVPESGERWYVTKERLDTLLGDNKFNRAYVKKTGNIKKEDI